MPHVPCLTMAPELRATPTSYAWRAQPLLQTSRVAPGKRRMGALLSLGHLVIYASICAPSRVSTASSYGSLMRRMDDSTL